MEMASLMVATVMVEAVWEALKPVWPKFILKWEENKGFSLRAFGVMLLGVIVCLGTDTDVFKILDIPMAIPYLGNVVTGIIVARGGNYVHSFFNAVKYAGQKNKKTDNNIGLFTENRKDIVETECRECGNDILWDPYGKDGEPICGRCK